MAETKPSFMGFVYSALGHLKRTASLCDLAAFHELLFAEKAIMVCIKDWGSERVPPLDRVD
jgi:hypothetical protein